MHHLKSKWIGITGIAVSLGLSLLGPIAATASAPAPAFSWANRAGGSNWDYSTAIGTDTNSNIYVVGGVLSTNADFGPFTFSSGSALAKYSPQGNINWVRRVATGANAGSLDMDAHGNLYLCGSYNGSAVFDGASLPDSGLGDFYVSKFDRNGTFLWANKGGSTNSDFATDIAVQPGGANLFVAGSFYGYSTMVGTNTFISGMGFGNQLHVSKWTADGSFVWAKAATGTNLQNNGLVAADPAGNVYWVAGFSGIANFTGGTTLTSSPPNRVNTFVAKYGPTGNLLALSRFAGTNLPTQALTDPAGNLFIAGTFNGSLNFPGASLVANGISQDIFVAKFSPASTLLWARQGNPNVGQQSTPGLFTASLDAAGNLYFGGSFNGSFTFGPTTLVSSNGASTILSAAFSQDGDHLWARSATTNGSLSGIAVDAAQRLLFAGNFQGRADFNNTILNSSANSHDIFVGSLELTAPLITQQPANQTNHVGSNVVFTVAATGRPPLTYQWMLQGQPIAGATTTSLLLTNLQYNRAVSLQVFSPGSFTQSGTATVTVTYFPGEELRPPPGAVLTNSPLTGPVVSGTGQACWVPDPLTRGHLYAASNGSLTITWKDAATNDLVVSALVVGRPAEKFVLGQEIPPPPNASLNPPPTSSVPGAVFWHEATKKLYAAAPVANSVITWQNGTCVGTTVTIENTWPTNENIFQLNIANTPPVLLTNWGPNSDAKLLAQEAAAGVDGAAVTNNKAFAASGSGRSLLLLSPDNPQVTTNIYFQFVRTIPYYEPTNLHDQAQAFIGDTIGDPFGYNTATNAAPYLFNALSRYCVSFHNRALRTGPIIPVNRDRNSTTNDDMVVVYYQQGLKLFEPGTGSLLGSALAWPWKPVRYQCQWPLAPDGLIVIASQNGSGPVPLSDWSVYRQNNPNQAGYNPNEEHALKLPAKSSGASLKVDSTGVQVLEGSSVPVTVSLSSTNNLPAGNLVVSVSGNRDGDQDLSVFMGDTNVNEVTLTPANLAAGYTFYVAAAPDPDSAPGTNEFTVRISGALFAEQIVRVREADTNSLGLVVNPAAFAVTEGSSKAFSVRLTQPPAGNVSVFTRRDLSADSDLSVQSGALLTFTPGDWDQPQPVVLAAAEDGDFFASSSNRFFVESFGGLAATNIIYVDEFDNDVPPDAAFALRSDLGDLPGAANPQYSEPYVLLMGTNNLSQPAILVYRVLAEQPTNTMFRYPGVAGRQIQPPYPLSLLVGWEQMSTGVSGPFWQDRKKFFWAGAAGNNGGTANIVMRFYYPVQNSFDFPKLGSPPAVASLVPWLDDLPGGTHGQPVNINYEISWPTVVPELRVGETLVKPKFGLPAIAGQTSVDVIYQQSSALDMGSSVSLIDPTFNYSATLATLPADLTGKLATNLASGNVFFVNLPPHLRGRIWFEPLNQKLKFKGEFRPAFGAEEPSGYLLLNVLTDRDKAFLLDPVSMSSDATFAAAVNNLAAQASQARVALPNAPFDSLALTAGLADAPGYVTLAFNNATNSTTLPPGRGTPISVEIIRVTCPAYRGEVKVITSDNPLDEKLTLRHTGDFAGKADGYVFEWKYRQPPAGGGKPAVVDSDGDGQPDGWLAYPTTPANGRGSLDITVAGSGLRSLVDGWYICRYRSTNINFPCGTDWSAWTEPSLAEGWIKRALAGINPFEQKFTDYAAATVDTIVNMISQAGARSIGSVPLDVAALNGYGLIEIYETILKRGIELSVDGNPPVSDPAANKALLGAARRLADLYLLLGNEAYADASDPTIGFGTEGLYASEASPSIFCFMDQVASLLDEELGLMRGLDDSLGRNVRQHPSYNRLRWNFTRNITGGEVAYALNYNIRAQAGNTNISAATAQLLYPQGHGDAWGHYLSAIKFYYRLIRNPNFDWNPDVEFVTLGGIGEPIPVNFLDERKFAKIAAAKAQTGAEIVNLTYRSFYSDDPAHQWQGYTDSNTNRAWGVSEWAGRSGQGALVDWALGNALLPATSTNQGIQKVDRTTVTELREVAAAFLNIQEQVDKADGGLNPLGLVNNVVPFDINPNEIDNNTTHFEQIYNRAIRALNNSIAVFNYANNSSQLLRRQADAVNDFQKAVADRESDFKNRLIEAFGYPYSDDIGPLGTYPTGYDGPDLYHYMYVDPSRLLGVDSPPAHEYSVKIVDNTVAADGSLIQVTNTVKYHVAANGFGFVKPLQWLGARRAPGELQLAHLDLLQAKARFERALAEYDNLIAQIQSQADLLEAQYAVNAEEITILDTGAGTQKSLNEDLRGARIRQLLFRSLAQKATLVANALAEANPKVLGVIAGLAGGVIADATSPMRSAIQLAGVITSEVMRDLADRESVVELDHEHAKEAAAAQQNIQLATLRQDQAILHQIAQLEQLVRQEVLLRLEIYNQRESLQQASGRYSAALARGQRLLEDRLRFRQQTAEQVQSYRYKDMAFRIFRNDALQKYRAQFDLAATYVYLAAKAYDFDTNLRPNDPSHAGSFFINKIVRARSLGLIQNGLPQTGGLGDPGLADPMAAMAGNFAVLKSQLGFDNKQQSAREFSLRSQLFRISSDAAGNPNWREALKRYKVDNILDSPDFRRHCLFSPTQPEEPGLIIPIATTIDQDLNLFGWPAGAGDSSFNPTAFSTKVRSGGITLLNYRISGGAGLRQDPRVYLVPVGADIMRSPRVNSFDNINYTREWRIQDQWLPAPFLISNKLDPRLAPSNWIPSLDLEVSQGFSLSQLATVRAHASFDAYYPAYPGAGQDAPQFESSRIIGRSVWNTRWLLVIPAVNLLSNDRQEGLARFIDGGVTNTVTGARDLNGITDIRLRLKTYAYTGR